jgi:hypothetical protein
MGRLGDGVIGREVGDESFLQFSIHFIFVNLWLYKNKTLEVTEECLGDGVIGRWGECEMGRV